MRLKTLKRLSGAIADSRASHMFLNRAERWSSHSAWLRVLAYHRIDTAERNPDIYPGLISASPADFAKQMQFLAEHAHVVSWETAEKAFRGEAELPPRAVLLTFDDATIDFAEFAWPTLQRLGLPATVFVPTAYPDQPQNHFWWDRLYRTVFHAPEGSTLNLPDESYTLGNRAQRVSCFRQLKERLKQVDHAVFLGLMDQLASVGVVDPPTNNVLSWDQLRELNAQGVTLAPHTRTHPMLNRVSAETAVAEIVGSWQDLSEQISPDVPRILAYPAGGVNPIARQALEDAGFEFAFSTRRGINRIATADRLSLNRINVGQSTTLGLLRLQLI